MINYPVVRSVALPTALAALAIVTAAALAVLSVPGYLASRVSAGLACRTDRQAPRSDAVATPRA